MDRWTTSRRPVRPGLRSGHGSPGLRQRGAPAAALRPARAAADERDRQGARRAAACAWRASTSRATTRPTGASTAAPTRPSTPTRAEDTAFWEAELGRELGPGAFGENLTTEGLDVSGAVVGERWRIGDVELEVCQPRLPCAKLALRMGDPTMVKRFAQASRPGRVPADRRARASSARATRSRSSSRPAHGVTVREVSDAILLDEALLARGGRRRRSCRPSWPRGCASGPRSAGERQTARAPRPSGRG